MKKPRRYLDAHPQLRRLYRNAGIVFSGNIFSSVFAILTLAVITRALSLEDFGRYALITAYIGLIDRLVSFQTWQAIIHYGSHAREQNDTGKLISLFTFGWLLDMGSGILGYLLAISGAFLIPHWFGLGDDAILFSAIAGCLLLVNWSATPTALMRLYDRFYAQALYQKTSAALMFAASVVMWVYGVDTIMPYLIAGTISGMTGKLMFFFMAVMEAKKQNIWRLDLINLKQLFATTPRLWRFVLTTNADGIVRVLRDIDIFIVNALLDTAMVGLYKIARTLTKAFGQITGPFYQAIYPELARMTAAKDFSGFSQLMRQSAYTLGAIVGAAWLGFVIVGPYILPLAFGAEYAAAYGVSVACMAAMVVWAFAQPLSPAMMALGKVGSMLIIHLATSLAYVGMLVVCSHFWGLIGAGIALFLFYLAWSLSIFFALKWQLAKQHQNS